MPAAKHDLLSITNLLESQGSKLLADPGKYTTKTHIQYTCILCNGIGYAQLQVILKSGPRCADCSKNVRIDKMAKTNTGAKRTIVNKNPNQGVKKRKYNVTSLTNLIAQYGATLLNSDEMDDKIGTKTKVSFVCNCGIEHTKQVRDISRGGAYCHECTKIQKSDKISEKKTKIPETVSDPDCEHLCSNCKKVYPLSEFQHDQSDDIATVWCKTCRDKKKVHNNTLRERRKISTLDDPTKQKCTSCLVWRSVDDFENDNTSCASVCRKNGLKGWYVHKERCEAFNATNDTLKMCMRCWKKCDKSDFITDVNHIDGKLCSTCRQQIFTRSDEIADAYLNLKKGQVCGDCGLDDYRFLEFDHVDPSNKQLLLSEAKSLAQLKTEIAKCVLRCGLCHIRRTKMQLNYGDGNRQKRYVDDIKREIGGCAKCGWYDPNLLEGLQFDHIDPKNKEYCVSYLVAYSKSLDLIDKEIEKCQLLCINCHKLKTIEDNGYYLYFQETFGKTRAELRQHRIDNGGKLTLDCLIDDAVF